MNTVNLDLSEGTIGRLTEVARQMGISVEDLLQRVVEDFVNRKTPFESAAEYVLRKNEELYRRLAQ